VSDPDERLIQAAKRQVFDDEGSPGQVATETVESQDHPATAQVSIEGYEIISELHRGGQGVVYKAFQASMKREVAIKVLLGGTYASPSAKRRFEREIELVASLRHPNVVNVHDSGTTGDGQPYCVMDYIDGQRLDQYVRATQLTLEDTLTLFGKICDAVTYAHQRGVIHRDLKPSNILVDSDGSPKVLDFGLAKNLTAPVDRVISVTGQVLGTLPYMSPEQAQGSIGEIDTRTDVYALGVILYELLTGRYPYPVVGQMADVLKHIAETPATAPTRQWTPESGVSRRTSRRLRTGKCPIDDEVQTIVLRCLAKERARRYESAGGLLRDIERYLGGQAIEAKRDSTWYVLRKLVRRHAVASIALACVFVTIVSFGVISFVLYQQTQTALREQQVSDQLANQRSRELQDAIGAFTQPAVRRMVLGWFLAAWRADQLDWAGEIQQRTPEGSPESIGMAFLLDAEYSGEKLFESLPVESAALGHFLVGERHRKAGRTGQAIEAYERCLSEGGEEWLQSTASATLRQLRGEAVGDAASGEEP
jgi:non-specific serine/threonine protein kinase/serine/threonine-protein kinase